MSQDQKIVDLYGNIKHFEDVLDEADENVVSAWDEEFINGIKIRYERYGQDMFLSDNQNEQLNRIATGD